MPEMTGIEATEKIRKMHSTGQINLRETKILVYSCLSNTADIHSLSQHFDGIAKKPADKEDLK